MDIFNEEYFKKLIPTSSIKSVKELSGLVSSSRIFEIQLEDGMMFARKSAGYYGLQAWQAEMLYSHYAAVCNLSPKIIATDENSLLSVFEYIHDVGCLELYKREPHRTKKRLADLLRSIHSLKPQPFMKPRNILEEIKNAIEKIPNNFLKNDAEKTFNNVLAISWPTDRMVVTHFDFHQKNILYDGKKLWMIDWEIGGLGHPFFDIAVLSNYLFLDEEEGLQLLSCYLDGPVSDQDKRTYNNLRQISYAFLASINFFVAASGPENIKNSDEEISPSFENLFSIWAKATRENDLAINYQLGLFFIRQCEKF